MGVLRTRTKKLSPLMTRLRSFLEWFAGRVEAESISMGALDSAQPLHPIASQAHADTSKTRSITTGLIGRTGR